MPPYELSVIVRAALQRPELKVALKRVCNAIYDKGGVIRKMENLGSRELPYTMKAHGEKHNQGNYIIIQFDSSAQSMLQLKETYKHDLDVIKTGIVVNEEEPRRPCLDGQCLFGELIHPEHDKLAYSKKTYRRLKYPRSEEVFKHVK